MFSKLFSKHVTRIWFFETLHYPWIPSYISRPFVALHRIVMGSFTAFERHCGSNKYARLFYRQRLSEFR